jgi:hypothetical protein
MFITIISYVCIYVCMFINYYAFEILSLKTRERERERDVEKYRINIPYKYIKSY